MKLVSLEQILTVLFNNGTYVISFNTVSLFPLFPIPNKVFVNYLFAFFQIQFANLSGALKLTN